MRPAWDLPAARALPPASAATARERPPLGRHRPVRRPVRLTAAAVLVGWHGGGGAASAAVAPGGHVGQRAASMGGKQRHKAGRSAQIQSGSWGRGIKAQGAIMGRGEAPRRPTHLERRREGVRGRRDDGGVECRRREHLQGKARVRKGCSRAHTEWVTSRELQTSREARASLSNLRSRSASACALVVHRAAVHTQK